MFSEKVKNVLSNDAIKAITKTIKNPRALMLGAGMATVIALTTVNATQLSGKNVTIEYEDGGRATFNVSATYVRDAIALAGVDVSPYDEVYPALDSQVQKNSVIQITRAKDVTLNIAGQEMQLKTAKKTVADVLASQGITLNEDDKCSAALYAAITPYMNIDVTLSDVVTEVLDVPIAYSTTRETNNQLADGAVKVVQDGKDGLKRETYRIKYENGVEVSRELVNTVVVNEPVAKVTQVGNTPTLASRGGSQSRGDVVYSNVVTMQATAYCPCSKCCGPYSSGYTATGMRATKGVIAVDPRVIPLGSKVFIETPDGSYVYGTAVAADTGGAIKGNRIDLCFNSHSEALAFGRRSVKVYIQ
ncbi:MAG: G5 domain-containing protein [Clostridiales bacterium]|jgi:uncharacterized protein YabE (DUF348 family)|nr:G5 domain-containing protein [Clostridiales bacterium]